MSGCRARASAVAISRVTPAVSAAGSIGLNCAGSTVYGSSGSSITSRGPTRYTGPAGSLRAICRARWTSCLTLRPVRISLSYLTKPRRMPRWSRASWIQWMNSLRLPGSSPSSVYGEAPGEDEHRDVAAHRVADLAAEVLRPAVDVDDDRLRLPGHAGVGVRGGQRHHLVRADDEPRVRVFAARALACANASIRPGWSLPRLAKT